MSTTIYRGRFAPSPTGPLHFGSLVAALASYLDAKSQGGQWLLRIEDLDPPREVAGATGDILRTLDAFGLHWDERPVYQSRRIEAYEAALDELMQMGRAFRCGCSRKQLADAKLGADGTHVYPGTCRDGSADQSARAIRVKVEAAPIAFVDAIQGRVSQSLAREVGDFIVRRADGWIAYQLAVVVDDAWQQITDIVRGADLLDSTPRQIWLQRLLGYATPRYAHIPLALNSAGEKLSKQSFAPAVDARDPAGALYQALKFLDQHSDPQLQHASCAEILLWAREHWQRQAIRARSRPHAGL